MTFRNLSFGVAIFGITALAAIACGDGDDPDNGAGGSGGSAGSGGKSSGGSAGSGGESHGSGASDCLVLGELCHRVDDTDGPLHECHEVGHVGDAAECAAQFDDCATSCIEAVDEGAAGSGAGGAPADLGPIKCAALGELCHPVDDGDGPLNECHELGHVADAAECDARYDECVMLCIDALEAAEGAGGAGGMGGSPG